MLKGIAKKKICLKALEKLFKNSSLFSSERALANKGKVAEAKEIPIRLTTIPWRLLA